MKSTIDLLENVEDYARLFRRDHEVDLEILANHIMNIDSYERSIGTRSDLNDQLRMLAREFFGKPALLYYHAGVTVHIRRKIDIKINGARFFRLWHDHGDLLLQQLDSRWLVSACDTIMDVSEDTSERAIALAGTLFTNTIKLYETERAITGQTGTSYAPLTQPVPLMDGLTTFMVGSGDMVANLMRRSQIPFPDHLLAPRILRELIARARRHDTVYRRFALVHQNEATRW